MRPSSFEGWELWEHDELPSTNDAAASMPPWSAVTAIRQNAGRGRHQRVWVSDAGGLWLSLVVPRGRPESGWSALPLAAGLAVCEAMQELGARGLRLRWPNDVMVGRRKLAGLLIEQVRPGTTVIGLGINLANRPEDSDPRLEGTVIRLAELIDPMPARRVILGAVLRQVRVVLEEMNAGGFRALVERVNGWWQIGVPMDIETDAGQAGGAFLGVDPEGRLRVGELGGAIREWAAHQVVRVRERTEERWL